jgi:hypothetical protein
MGCGRLNSSEDFILCCPLPVLLEERGTASWSPSLRLVFWVTQFCITLILTHSAKPWHYQVSATSLPRHFHVTHVFTTLLSWRYHVNCSILPHHCHVIATLLPNCCHIISTSLPLGCQIVAISLPCCCYIILTLSTYLLLNSLCHVIAMLLPCHSHVIAI